MTTQKGSNDLKKRSLASRPTPQARSQAIDASSEAADSQKSLRIPNLFGSSLRAEILALVAGLERTYPRELARLIDRPISMVQRVIADLERAGVLVTRLNGNQREVRLNSDYIAAKELAALLEALIEREPRYRNRLVQAARRRPRRVGKSL